MQSFDFHPSTRVAFGEGALEHLKLFAQDLDAHRILLVTDPGIAASGILEQAIHTLRTPSLETYVFDGVHQNPTTAHVEAGVRFARECGEIDLIVGLGGGSAMDCAKGINFLLTNGGVMQDYWGFGKANQPMLSSIGIPTTAGTGSEAQSYALISQTGTHRKMACGDPKARFSTVILDPSLIESIPRKVAAVTGMDAIAHAVESYVTTSRNAISQMFAREAWRLLDGNFETSLTTPSDTSARGNMLLGAHLAGAAIENSMLGATHACANPLTARYGIPHGAAIGLMLPHVIEFNTPAVDASYQELLHTSQHQSATLQERIACLRDMAGLPEQLRHYGMDRGDLPQLAQEASNEWTGGFNPRPVSQMELLQLYEAAY